MKLKILFENPFFYVLDKPAGMTTIPDRQGSESILEFLKKEQSSIFVVHRLDREVSGVLLFAKTAEAHKAACGWFEQKKVKKTYEAWTEPTLLQGYEKGDWFEWRSILLKGKKRAYERPHGKLAVTRAKWVGEISWNQKLAWKWMLQPQTGRTHQLRYELHKRHCPILGDRLYGSKETFRPHEIALRAVELDFEACLKREDFSLPLHVKTEGLTW